MQTLFIGLDGATYTALNPMIEQGVMPFLKRFIEGGVHAVLNSTPHPFSPPAWTSVITGRNPGNHGIFDWVRIDPGDDYPQYTIATSRDVKAETIYSIAHRNGVRSISLNFPFMFPPRPVDGYIVPAFVPPRHLRRFVHPPSLYEQLKALPGFDAKTLLLDLDDERESLQVLPEEEYASWIRFHIQREMQWTSIVLHLMKTDPCAFTSILFDGVDKLQHIFWRFIDPALFPEAPTPWEVEIRDLCLEYFRKIDGHLEQIVSAAGPEARVFMISDHGFTDTREIFYVNTLLHQHGLLEWADKHAKVDTEGRQMNDGNQSPVILFDWEKTSAYALTAGSNGVYLKVASKPGEAGIPADKYIEFRERVVQILLDARHPQTGLPIVKDVLRRDAIFPGDENHRLPDLTLQLHDYGFISILNSDVIVKPRSEIAGTHHPEGVFFGRGPGIPNGRRLDAFSIMDIPSLLMYSMGLPIPDEFEGRFPAEVFLPEALTANPVRTGNPTIKPETFFENKDVDIGDSEEEKILDRLRALGYIE